MLAEGYSDYERDDLVDRRFGEPDFELWTAFDAAGLKKVQVIEALHAIHASQGLSITDAKKRINAFTPVAYKLGSKEIVRDARSNPSFYSEGKNFGHVYKGLSELDKSVKSSITEVLSTEWGELAAARLGTSVEEVLELLSVGPDLRIVLTAGAISNGYVSLPNDQTLFPKKYFGGAGADEIAEKFELLLPDGNSVRTDIRSQYGKSGHFRSRFYKLFHETGVKEGMAVIIRERSPDLYEMIIDREISGEATLADSLKQEKDSMKDIYLNQILYGPPGTGKTYHTVNRALDILDPNFYEANKADRSALKSRFDELKAKGRIDFVTFHQSFSYEDFVEGLRASTDEEGQIHYEVEDGIFKRICDAASAKVQSESYQAVDVADRRIWKMSLGNTLGADSHIYDDCISNNQILLGYGQDIDFSGAVDRNEIKRRIEKSGQEPSKHDYGVSAVNTFINQMKVGDLVIVTDGNLKFRAIGEITGDYQYLDENRDWYWQSRPVKWHRTYSPSLPAGQLMNKAFSQMTLYELRPISIDLEKLQGLLGESSSPKQMYTRPFKEGEVIQGEYSVESVSPEILEIRKPNGSVVPFTWKMLDELADLIRSGQLKIEDIGSSDIFDGIDTTLEKYIVNGYKNFLPSILSKLLEEIAEDTTIQGVTPDAWVLIIDEINRGNIANILGELITLIEPSKRAGAEEALEVALPYSKTKFSVPDNLYIIGTMNTADRSLVHIDTALRRRFQFEAMLPDIEVLKDLGIQNVEGVDIQKMLRTINSRIELLYDKDHTLGHSFFVPLQTSPDLVTLAQIFRNQIMPLLEEYFFEDWSRIQQILADDQKSERNLKFYVPSFEPEEIENLLVCENGQVIQEKAFKRNEQALLNAESYRGIYEPSVIT